MAIAEAPRIAQEYQLVYAPAVVLSSPAEEVTDFGNALDSLVVAMKRVMRDHHALGLAAPQVGASKRVLIYTPHSGVHPDNRDERLIVNPRLTGTSGDLTSEYEGCLSIPRVRVEIVRASIIDVEGQSFLGAPIRVRLTGKTARIVQHEIDHLDGVSILDRVGLEFAGRYPQAVHLPECSTGSTVPVKMEGAVICQ